MTSRLPIALVLTTALGCSDGCKPAPAGTGERAETLDRRDASSPAAPIAVVPPGTLRGRVVLDGPPPPPAPRIDRHSDPVCARAAGADPPVIVDPLGSLANAFIQLTGDLPPAPAFDPASPAIVVEQRQCVYRPRVLAMRAGQRLEVRNSDATLHNVHLFRDGHPMLNRPQMEGIPPVRTQVAEVGLVELTCDVHPWMKAHAWVSPHPWFAVTGSDGRFEIAAAPSGRRTVTAWHEVFGTRTVEVTIPAGGSAEVEIHVGPAPTSR